MFLHQCAHHSGARSSGLCSKMVVIQEQAAPFQTWSAFSSPPPLFWFISVIVYYQKNVRLSSYISLFIKHARRLPSRHSSPHLPLGYAHHVLEAGVFCRKMIKTKTLLLLEESACYLLFLVPVLHNIRHLIDCFC
jgi:hypothetical protein